MNISKVATKFLFYTAFAGVVSAGAMKSFAQSPIKKDSVEFSCKVPPEGSEDLRFLKFAPKPELVFMGDKKIAKFVVTLGDNRLYQYNSAGEPIKVYSVATGKISAPTEEGVRVVSHVESFPYLTAPRNTKRRKNPKSYGPKIIILDKINLQTGEKAMTGQFIHGNRDITSIGKRVSEGCIRMDNDVIKYLSGLVKRGDFVIIRK